MTDLEHIHGSTYLTLSGGKGVQGRPSLGGLGSLPRGC